MNNKSALTYNLFTFFCLYIAQAIPMSFFATALQVMMRESNYSLTAIGLLSFIKLPWILKFLWAPIVDKKCVTLIGFKRFIIGSELVYALLLFMVGFLSIEKDLTSIVILIILSLVASATQDIATDALAILSFKQKDKGLVNSVQSMGSFTGALIGCGVLLIVLHKFGWSTIIPLLGIFVLIALIPLISNKSLQVEKKGSEEKVRLTDFIWFFKQKGIVMQIIFLTFFYSALMCLLAVLRPFMVDLGYDMKEIGFMSGIVGTFSALLFSLLSGFIIRKFSLYRSRIICAAYIMFITCFYMLFLNNHPTTVYIYIAIILLWSGYGMASTALYTTAMQFIRTGREGTDFTIQIVISHVTCMVIAASSSMIADKFGYQTLFTLAFAVACLVLIYCINFQKQILKQDKDERRIN